MSTLSTGQIWHYALDFLFAIQIMFLPPIKEISAEMLIVADLLQNLLIILVDKYDLVTRNARHNKLFSQSYCILKFCLSDWDGRLAILKASRQMLSWDIVQLISNEVKKFWSCQANVNEAHASKTRIGTTYCVSRSHARFQRYRKWDINPF